MFWIIRYGNLAENVIAHAEGMRFRHPEKHATGTDIDGDRLIGIAAVRAAQKGFCTYREPGLLSMIGVVCGIGSVHSVRLVILRFTEIV